jgi:mRNA interferase RelE/StbE
VEVTWKVTYKESVKKDLKKIFKDIQYIIKRAIEEKLMEYPVKFGLPLRRNLKAYMKLRVGDYRIIYSVDKDIVTVHVVKVGHRREVYEK